ncbi:ABC-2 type transport system ATP-binding protein [Anaeroplasma bactoclasticum]|jgi:ABC-2 type transport system ATP-binding protein|uniref:ABC-2 type transport system ATP-binding protein n=1 Tax=Anaeroplasma bactoclasticum TaxID=2088 RepID=A0A397RW25_9MOLU|nr:ATP-binding cassette domain-containing protein [Anaeroplasma bactoclasticum]RIA75837.1 ABC-2 type transport system ATP-binding protein [Anaeroplasma bactoclasticum]
MLELITVEKKYKDHTVFSNMTLSFKEGNLYILQGVNGSGKSTILKLIAGIAYKTSGKIMKSGSVSFLPDKFTFPKLMRVKSYLMEVFSFVKDKNKLYTDLISLYQIPNKRIGDLSKGNLEKLGILQILNTPADIYLLDEPLDGLDDFAKKILRDEIKNKLKENKIVILSLHNKTYFNELNPIIIEIKEGMVNEKKKRKEAN